MSLQYLLNKQADLNFKVVGEWLNKEVLTEEKFNEWLLKFSRALIHEVIELEDSTKWKWWKYGKIDINNLKIEAIDCLHFLLSIFLLLDMDAKEIVELYNKKNQLNHIRQEKGYKTGKYKKVDEKGNEDNVGLFDDFNRIQDSIPMTV